MSSKVLGRFEFADDINAEKYPDKLLKRNWLNSKGNFKIMKISFSGMMVNYSLLAIYCRNTEHEKIPWEIIVNKIITRF